MQCSLQVEYGKGKAICANTSPTYPVTDYRVGWGLFLFSERTEALKRGLGASYPEISRTLFKEIGPGLHKMGFTPLSSYAYCFSKGRTISGISTRRLLDSPAIISRHYSLH